jgi:hypothetical protein
MSLNDVIAAKVVWIRRKCNTLKMVANWLPVWCNVQESQWPPYRPPGTKGTNHKDHSAVSQDCSSGLYTVRQISKSVEMLKVRFRYLKSPILIVDLIHFYSEC